MTPITDLSFFAQFALNLLTTAFKLSGCVLSVAAVYGLKAKNKMIFAVLLSCYAAGFAFLSVHFSQPGSSAAELAGVLLPLSFYAVLPLAFFSRKAPGILLLTFCFDLLSGAVKYILLMLSGFDWLSPGDTEDVIFQLVSDSLLFIGALVLYLLRARGKRNGADVLASNPGMFILITVTLAVFILTMVVLGENNAEEKRGEFLLCLVNIPLFTCTVVYAVRKVIKAKMSEENYRKNLDMQLRHYEIMDRKNDEMRVFRHDLPKKLGPLLLFAEQGNIEEVKSIIAGFRSTVEAARPRFTTGNYRLDTVLECEQQTAEKRGVSIEFTPGSVFPAEGIAADDIYTIFPNALDNAVEAAEKTEKPVVSVSSAIAGDTVFICIENPYAGSVVTSGDTPVTGKADRDSHGYGYKSIRKAAARYGKDNVRFETENGIFRLFIELNIG